MSPAVRTILSLLLTLPRAVRAAEHACLADALGGRLVFLHVMKTGGLSVNAMLRCRCSSATTPCAFLRDDGGAKRVFNATRGDLIARFREGMLYGRRACGGGEACAAVGLAPMDGGGGLSRAQKASLPKEVTHKLLLEAAGAPCAAQLLATHYSYHAVLGRPYWSRASFITVLREPVARVWSFAQYARRKSPIFQQTALLDVLRGWRSTSLNASHVSPHHHHQLSNMMTLTFALRHGAADADAARELASRGSAQAAALIERARESLGRMEVVGVTEDMAGFERVLAARWPLFFGRAGCAITPLG